MSAEARKNCRTQGRYSDKNHEDKKYRKSLEKRLKESPTERDTQEKKFLKRKSDGTKEGTSFSSENKESVVEYQENSGYSLSKGASKIMEERKKPIEIRKAGKIVLSKTENGESSVLYKPNFYSKEESRELFDLLRKSTNWLDKNIVIQGVEYPQPRLVAWYGPLPYSYSGTTLEPAEMPDCVLAIKKRVEDYLKGQGVDVELNSVLLNLYRHNKDSVSWHSDDELTMGVCPTIASISLGETRRFEMRPKSNRYCEEEDEKADEYFVHLSDGSLIVMDGCMQEDWQHRVPKEYHDKCARINLTFRTVYKYEDGSPYSDSRVNDCKLVDGQIPKNTCSAKIELDDTNFPSLSSLSSNGNSRTAHKPYAKDESPSKINDFINSSEDPWLLETPPTMKANSRINDKICGSEDVREVKTPDISRALFKENDMVSTSTGEYATVSDTGHRRDDDHKYLEDCVNYNPLYENSVTTTLGPINVSNENPAIRPPSYNRAYPDAVRKSENRDIEHSLSDRAPVDMNISNTSEWSVDGSPVKNNSCSQSSDASKSHYSCYEEPAYNSQPESDNNSHKDWYNASVSNEVNELHEEEKHRKSYDHHGQTSLESDKIYKPRDNRHAKSFTRPNRMQSDRTYRHHDERYEKPLSKRNDPSETRRSDRYNGRGPPTEPFRNKNNSKPERSFRHEKGTSFESRDIERSAVYSNENADGYQSRPGKNQNYDSREKRNGSSNYAVNSMRRHFTDIRNEPKSNEWKPNVKAEEFVPGKAKKPPSNRETSNTYGEFSLQDLLNYDMDRMPSDDLQMYASALKSEVEQSLSQFKQSDNEELKVLCALTDGNQTDRNQRIICSRILVLVKKYVSTQWNPQINAPIPRYNQQAHYRNENHSDRRFQISS